MNIPELRLKVKECLEILQNREIYTAFLIILVGLCSFGLGRLSKLQEGRSGIHIEQAGAVVLSAPSPQRGGAESALPAPEGRAGRQGSPELLLSSSSLKEEEAKPLALGGQYIASKGGTKYYFPWCGSASRISEANKVWFASVAEARKAGYTPAANCKGLK